MEKLIESLVDFVERTSKNENASPEAFEALPKVAKLLLDIDRLMLRRFQKINFWGFKTY